VLAAIVISLTPSGAGVSAIAAACSRISPVAGAFALRAIRDSDFSFRVVRLAIDPPHVCGHENDEAYANAARHFSAGSEHPPGLAAKPRANRPRILA